MSGFTINIPGAIPTIDEWRQTAPIGISPLGTPVFDDITFPAGQWVNDDGNTVEYEEVKFTTATVQVTQSKNIIKTSVAGRNNTIKEYVSLSDYEISISGKFTQSLMNIFPVAEMFGFKSLANCPESIPILSKFLNEYFDIFDVVIDTFDVSPIIGTLNEVQINMTLLSDVNVNLNSYVE